MKKFALLLTLLITLTIHSIVSAGNEAGKIVMSPFIGGNSFFGEQQHLETAPLYGLRLGYNFTDHYGAEALFNFISTKGTKESDVGLANVYNYRGEFLYHFLPENQFVPFVAAGFGGSSERFENGGSGLTRAAFDYGVGAKYFLSENIALRGDIRHIMLPVNKELASNIEYMVGVSYILGREKTIPLRVWVPQPVSTAAAAPEPSPTPERILAPAIPASAVAALPLPLPGEVAQVQTVDIPKLVETAPAGKYLMILNIEFATGKADIQEKSYYELMNAGEFLTLYPASIGTIEGHTDNVGSRGSNLRLSEKRAASVRAYLVKNFGINPQRLAVTGAGPDKPVGTNKTKSGRQKNRRVNVVFYD